MTLTERLQNRLRTCAVAIFMTLACIVYGSAFAQTQADAEGDMYDDDKTNDLVVNTHSKEADNAQQTMLLINSYSENAPWSQSFARPINDKLSQYPDVHLDMISLNSAEVKTREQYDVMVDNIFQAFADNPPQYVIMIGNFAFTLRDRIQQEWGDIPILLLSRIDRYAPLDYYFAGYSGPCEWDSLPLISDVRDKYNMTTIVTPDFCGENIELMHHVIPELKKIVFISDNVYSNRSFDSRIRHFLKAHYPDMQYEWLQASDSTMRMFQNYMLNKHPYTGLLISTWASVDRNYEATGITGGHLHMISSAANPVFSLSDSYLALGALGGYYHDLDAGGRVLAETVGAMLDGRDMRSLPLYVFDAGAPVINHQRMAGLGFKEADFPQGTRYIFRAPTLWEAYRGYIIPCALILLILIVGTIVYLTIQRKRITLLKTHALFIKNMPWAYSKARILYDRKGKIYDIEYVNDTMNEEFASLIAENHLPNYDDKIFPFDFIAEKTTEVVETGNPVKFTFHFEGTDKYYDILLCRINPTSLRPGERPHDVDIFANDITEVKKQEEALIAAKERAKEADRMKSAFLANMSHEIRTPLNAIVGFSSLIAQTDDAGEKAQYASIIERNNEQLLRIINDVLDLAKIESNFMDITIVDTDLNDLMQDVYDSVRLRIAEGVVFNKVLGAEKCHFRTDSNRVTQILINLLTNAAKFTSKGNITYGYEINGDEVYFFVRDTGIGISKENQAKLFQRFSKVNDHSQGTGLGLSICKSFIEKMGGTIGVTSRGEGKGATFWFTLPYVKVENPTPIAVTENKVIDVPVSDGAKITILVAEDNESNYTLFEQILSKDYSIIRAHNGREAVEMYEKYKPQLILMDIRMPEMDGFEAANRIRKISAKVPIIAVTAHAYKSERNRILNSGFNDYVSKPIDVADLLNAVNTQLNKRLYTFNKE